MKITYPRTIASICATSVTVLLGGLAILIHDYALYWAVVNCVFRLILTGFLIVGLSVFRESLIPLERFGIGLMGGSSFLTIGPIMDINKQGTAFDGWAPLLLTIGCIILFSGRIYRFWRHKLLNADAKVQTFDYLVSRNKL